MNPERITIRIPASPQVIRVGVPGQQGPIGPAGPRGERGLPGGAQGAANLLRHEEAVRLTQATFAAVGDSKPQGFAAKLRAFGPIRGGLLGDGQLAAEFGGEWEYERPGVSTDPEFGGPVAANAPRLRRVASGGTALPAGSRLPIEILPFPGQTGVAVDNLVMKCRLGDGRILANVGATAGDLYAYDAFTNVWSQVGSLPNGSGTRRAGAIRLMSDGSLLASTYEPGGDSSDWEGVLLRSTDDGATWVQVLNMSPGFAYMYNISVLGARVLVSTYGPRNSDPPSGFAWLSDDHGATWTLVFDFRDHHSGPVHCHFTGICPYNSDRFILTTGDSTDTRRMFVTTDGGATWFEPTGDSNARNRTTAGVWLSDTEVLLGPDGYDDEEGPFALRLLNINTGDYTDVATLTAPVYRMWRDPAGAIWAGTVTDTQQAPSPVSISALWRSHPHDPTLWSPVGAVRVQSPGAAAQGILDLVEPSSDGYLGLFLTADERNFVSASGRVNLRDAYTFGVEMNGGTNAVLKQGGVGIGGDSPFTVAMLLSPVLPRVSTGDRMLSTLHEGDDPTPPINGFRMYWRNTGTGVQDVWFSVAKVSANATDMFLVGSARRLASNLTDVNPVAVVFSRSGPGAPFRVFTLLEGGGVQADEVIEPAGSLSGSTFDAWSVGGYVAPGNFEAGATIAAPLLFNRAVGAGEAAALLETLMSAVR